jgi:hypothetical protein
MATHGKLKVVSREVNVIGVRDGSEATFGKGSSG